MGNSAMELDNVFERLLLDSGFRKRYRSGEGGVADDAVNRAMSTLDWDEFERLVRRVRRNIVNGELGGIAIGKETIEDQQQKPDVAQPQPELTAA